MEVFFVSISKHSSFFCCCCLTWGGRSGRNGRNPLDLDSHTYLTLTQALYLQVTSSPSPSLVLLSFFSLLLPRPPLMLTPTRLFSRAVRLLHLGHFRSTSPLLPHKTAPQVW